MLHLIGTLGADGCGYKSVEFYGSALPAMSISERMTMANLAMEMGSKCVFIPPDQKTREWLLPRLHNAASYQPVIADENAVYEQSIEVDLSTLTPMIACPHQVENTKPVTEVIGTRIDQAFLGSCANGKYEDLVVTADILKGRKIDPRVRLIRHARVEGDHAGGDAHRRARDADGKWRAGDEPGVWCLRGRRRDDGRRRSLALHREPQFRGPHGQATRAASICRARRRSPPLRSRARSPIHGSSSGHDFRPHL